MNVYISKNGDRSGPFSIAEVIGFIRDGEYSMSDLIWREGMSEWQPIHSLSDVVAAVLPAIPTAGSTKKSESDKPTPFPTPLPSTSAPPDRKIVRQPTELCDGQESPKLRIPAILLCIFLGGFGLHAFYAGKGRQGAIFLVMSLLAILVANCGAGASSGPLWAVSVFLLVNTFQIALGKYKDGDGRLIKKWI